jgi:hypothetical protein
VKPKNARSQVRSPNKLLVKGAATSVSLPEMPSMNMAALADGNPLGAASKGLGGGAGGGEGGGIGVGRGGGRNMVSLFGTRDFNAGGLTGYYYDFKVGPRNQPRGYNNARYVSELKQFFAKKWDVSYLERTVKRADKALQLQHLFIPMISAAAAPKSFEAPGQPSNLMVHYSGTVIAPFTGKFRFVGVTDDWMCVRWKGKNVFEQHGPDMGWLLPLLGRGADANPYASKFPDGTKDQFPGANPGWSNMRCGPWLDVREGEKCPIEIAIGERPGGVFYSFLCFERKDKKGKVALFRTERGEVDPAKVQAEARKYGSAVIPPNVDWSGGGVIWKAQPGGRTMKR